MAIIDCCFAGRALDEARAADFHLLMAAGRSKKALTPQEQRHTGFTGALLRLLADGVPDGPEHLSLSTVHGHLAVTLPAGDLPEPLRRSFGATGELALTRNPAYGTATTRRGLRARARFAGQVRALGLKGRPRRAEQAVRLFERIAADAAGRFGPTEPDTLVCRHGHAVATGESGEPTRARALLERIVTDWEASAGANDERLANAWASLAYWRERSG